MTLPSDSDRPATGAATLPVTPPGERGWGKVILALLAFLILPTVPQFRALLPIDQTMVLFVPALAACTLVGWWAGGRAILAIAWVGLAIFVAYRAPATNDAFQNLAVGWSLVLAGAFGLVCLFNPQKAFFQRGLTALALSVMLALIMSTVGPVSGVQMSTAVREEIGRRNVEAMGALNGFIETHAAEWNQLTTRLPEASQLPLEIEKQLTAIGTAGQVLFPSMLALQSLMALAIAWSVYHRISRSRVGPPLGQLRDFRFNDQLVWGLIVGLTIVFLPTLSSVRSVGRNLLVFFGALYALRGLGVLSWFMAPGALAIGATVGFAMLWWPVLNAIAAIGFLFLAIAAFGLGLGDTWADWRNRAKSPT